MRRLSEDRRDSIIRSSHVVPKGFWTAYGEIGLAATGTRTAHRIVARLAAHDPAFSTPWRVLHADGSIADGWRGRGGGPEKCRELLESEGVRFVHGRADPAQKMLAEEIELLLADENGHAPGSN
jgi:alkylated DNA nucleotide flippase Atl1